MKRYTIIFTSLILMGTLVSCGEKPQSIEAKRSSLEAKKNALRTLSQEISDLEKEIAAMDPNAKAKSRQASVNVKPLAASEFKHFVEVQGKVESNNNIMVSPQTPGVVTQIFVREGQV
ncbi:MAG: efflux RND transporter periplasmic adaptor subunit, partial [Bacteroidetes bacterium]|nr:efflux RND transporter periplasmic adaptor subunit [Bacteroidota bacterium]